MSSSVRKRTLINSSSKTSSNFLFSLLILLPIYLTISSIPTTSAQQNTFSGSLSRSYILQLEDDASLEVLRAYSVGYTSHKGSTSTDHSNPSTAIVNESTGDLTSNAKPSTASSDPKSGEEQLVKWATTPKAPWAKVNEAWVPDQEDEEDLLANSSQRASSGVKRNHEDDEGRKMELLEREILENREKKWKGLGFETTTNGLIKKEEEKKDPRDRYYHDDRYSSSHRINGFDFDHNHRYGSSSSRPTTSYSNNRHGSYSYDYPYRHSSHHSHYPKQQKDTPPKKKPSPPPPAAAAPPPSPPAEEPAAEPEPEPEPEPESEPEEEAAERRSSFSSLIQTFFKRSGMDLIFKDQQQQREVAKRSPPPSLTASPQNSTASGKGNGNEKTNSVPSLVSSTPNTLPTSPSDSSNLIMNSNPSTDASANVDPNDPNMKVNNYDGNFFSSLPTYQGNGGFALPDVLEDTPSDPDSDIGWDASWPRPYPYFTIRHEFKHKRIFFGMSVTLTKPVTKAQSHGGNGNNDNNPITNGIQTGSGNTGINVNSQDSNPNGNSNGDVTTPLGKANPNSNPNSNLKSGSGTAASSVNSNNNNGGKLPANGLPVLITSSNPSSPGTGTGVSSVAPPSSFPVSDIAMLKSLPGVKAVFPVRYVPRPRPHGSAVLLSGPAQAKGAIEEAKNTLLMTGVEALHRQGIDGRGVRVAVLDTGVDYNHPALGGCFGPGCKIAFGHDLVGDWYDGTNDPVSGPDPHSECGPHGTHVSGIIGAYENGAKGQGIGLKGASPGVTLGMFRVFGCKGGAADDMLMKGMELAWESGAEVISISIGAPAGWPDSPTAIMASNVAHHGRVIAIAAGNDGSTGMFFPSSPAVGRDVLSVGSVENAYFTVFNLTVASGGHPQIEYFAARPFHLPALPLFVTSTDSPPSNRDACDPFPDWYPNLGNFIVLIRRGGCGLQPKFENIANAGAKYVLVYNPTDAMTPVYVEPMGGILKAGLIGAKDGMWLVEQYLQGVPVRLSFPDTTFSISNNYTGGTVSGFSSYGPTFDLASVVALSAPGGQILSTWPMGEGNYSIASGTSMATPFAAAAAALIIQASREGKTPPGKNGTLTAQEVVARLSTTCRPAYNATKAALLETVAKQGSGLLQVGNAVRYQTTVAPSTLYLNDTTNWNRIHTINVTNHGSNTLNYVVEHEPAGTALTFPKGTGAMYHNRGPVPLVEPHVAATMKPRVFSLEGGASQTITVTVDFPRVIDPQTFPILSGFIRISSSTPASTIGSQPQGQMSWTGLAPIQSQGTPAESLTVSYLGLGAPQNTAHMLDTRNGATKSYALPVVVVAKSGKPQRLPRSYSFSDGDVPVIQFRLVSGSRRTRVDVVQDVAKIDGQQDPSDTANQVQGNVNEQGAKTGLRRRGGSGVGEAEDTVLSAPDDVAPDSGGKGGGGGGSGGGKDDDEDLGPGTVPVRTTRIVGPIATTAWLARNSLDAAYGIYAVAWDGTAGGADVQRGEYRILLRTERIGWIPPVGKDGKPAAYDGDDDQTGKEVNPGGEEDRKRWEHWLSPIIRVDRAIVNTPAV